MAYLALSKRFELESVALPASIWHTKAIPRKKAPAIWHLRNDVVVPVVAQRLFQIVQVTQRKLKKTHCNSLFKHDLTRPTLTPRKHALTCSTVPIWSFMFLTVRKVSDI